MLRFTGQRPITPSALKDRKIGDELLQDVARYELHPCIVVLPAATRGVSVLSDLQAYRVGFNRRFCLHRESTSGQVNILPRGEHHFPLPATSAQEELEHQTLSRSA